MIEGVIPAAAPAMQVVTIPWVTNTFPNGVHTVRVLITELDSGRVTASPVMHYTVANPTIDVVTQPGVRVDPIRRRTNTGKLVKLEFDKDAVVRINGIILR